jgi:hypothetical protein
VREEEHALDQELDAASARRHGGLHAEGGWVRVVAKHHKVLGEGVGHVLETDLEVDAVCLEAVGLGGHLARGAR